MYDIVIIGAGPSGTTLARLLSSKYKVLMIDKRSYHKTYKKCCGGLLAPDAQRMIANLGLTLPKDVLVDPQIFSVRTLDFDNNIERFYQRHYINIDREKFDAWLEKMVPPHVERKFSTHFINYSREMDGICVDLRMDGQTFSVKTKILVGADGALSRVRTGCVFTENPDRYISIQRTYQIGNQQPYFTSIFDQEITDFYSWTIPKGDQLFVGSAIPLNENANKRFDLLIKKLNTKGYDLGDLVEQSGTLIMRPRNLSQVNMYKDNICLVGEAAGLISPSSAEGISYAFKSAKALAESLNETIDNFGELYSKKISTLKRNILLKNMKIPFMYYPKVRKLVMKSNILTMDIDI